MKAFLFLLLFGAVSCFAQTSTDPVYLPIDSTTGAVQFRDVVSLDPALDTKAIIQRARTWVATAYRSANDVVQQFDPEAGVLIVKGQFPINKVFRKGEAMPAKIAVYHMLTIEAKPGRYRATMTNFEQEAGTLKVPIRANHGSMSEQELLAETQKMAAGSGMEKMIMRSAQKNVTTTMIDNRLYTTEFKKEVLSIMESLKRQMQKKAEKDW